MRKPASIAALIFLLWATTSEAFFFDTVGPSKASSAPSWTRLQGNLTQSASTVSSLAFTTQNNTANSLLIATVTQYYGQTSTPSGDVTITDSAGNTWGTAYSHWWTYQTGSWVYVGVFYAVNTQGNQKITVNVGNYHPSVVDCEVAVEEYSGNATSSPLDGSAANGLMTSYGSGNQTISGPQITTSTNGDLIFAYCFDWGGNVTAISQGTGYSLGQYTLTDLAGPGGTEYETQTSSGSVTPTFAITASGPLTNQFFIVAAAFKAAGH